ncbi:hypothetical protein F2Q70_00028634 [Brassica cretica]|uniref:Ferritin n=1 Tax=Brassica cretica TaxID=69181 RepID=A0A8S9LFE2_BRACR|nr:hypothetical protein F2Q70_00028634 [Brassica cretica]
MNFIMNRPTTTITRESATSQLNSMLLYSLMNNDCAFHIICTQAVLSKSDLVHETCIEVGHGRELEWTFVKLNVPKKGMGLLHAWARNAYADSLARQKYSDECESAINEQINVEYNLSYVYHAMYAYFDRDNVALKGLAK